MKYGIKIHVRSSFSKKTGTMVVKEEKKLEKRLLLEFQHLITRQYFFGRDSRKPELQEKFCLLSNANINVDMIVQNITDDENIQVLLSLYR